jgi:hypothetical protein
LTHQQSQSGGGPWGPETLTKALFTTFCDPGLFRSEYVNDPQYLSMYRLHSHVCGLLVRIGVQAGFIVDVGRRHAINPVGTTSGRKQHQAEADVTFIDPLNDTPVALLDYETSDAPIRKMRNKFRYFNTFLNYIPTLRIVSFLITVTRVKHPWGKETYRRRATFARTEIPKLIAKFYRYSQNHSCSFLVGTFYRNHLEVRHFVQQGIRRTWKAHYS